MPEAQSEQTVEPVPAAYFPSAQAEHFPERGEGEKWPSSQTVHVTISPDDKDTVPPFPDMQAHAVPLHHTLGKAEVLPVILVAL